ncbi:MAG: peptidyl-prolyl cis-trans isomerase [Acidobacteriota bacterium]
MILDIMRREKKLLLGLLLAPLIFGLVAYLVPGVPGGVWGSGVSDRNLAVVDGAEISVNDFNKTYQRFLRSNRLPYDREFIRSLQLPQQVLNQLVSRQVILLEADRLGIDATANEIQQRILSLPHFLDNGNFLGLDRYEAILRSNGMTVQEFEEAIRLEIIQEKLMNLVTDSVGVSKAEVEDEFRRRNEKAKISYVLFDPASFTQAVVVTDADLKAHFEANRENYRIPERRSVQYLLVDTNQIRQTLGVSEAELRQYYQQNIQTYQLQERVKASHILFRTEGKSPEEIDQIRQKASEVLQRAKKGEDFAALARQFSEDPGSAVNGGDVGFFSRNGQMVPEFESAAFSLGVGAISDLVKTQFGFHIVKVTERQAAHTQSFDEVVNLIRPTIMQRKAEQAAQDLADKAYSLSRTKPNLQDIATELKLRVETTPLFASGGTVPVIGNSPEFSSKVFSQRQDEIGSPVRIATGFAIPQVVDIKPSYVPDLAEARPRVEQDFRQVKSVDLAKAKAEEFAKKAKTGASFDVAARSFGVTVKTSDDFTRNGNLPDLGSTAPVDEFAFSAKLGDISAAMAMGNRYMVAQLKEKTPIDQEELAKASEDLQASLLSQRKEQQFQAYLDSVRDKLQKDGKIEVNQRLFSEIAARL